MNKVISQDEDPQPNPNRDKETTSSSEPQAGRGSDRRRPSQPPEVGTDSPQETLALADDPTQDGATDPAVKIVVDSDIPLLPTVQFDSIPAFDSVPAEDSQTVVLGRPDDTGDFSVEARTRGRVRSSPTDDRATRISAIRAPDARMPGKVGNYTIQRVLGRGGMGVVYLAHQVDLNREVALKMVLAGGHASEAQLERFKSEARAVAQLQHPGIVQVFEVGEHEGLPYFSLEFVNGMSLDQRLDGKPLPPRDAAMITAKVCRAMQYAHDRGILHRDLKPANILVTESGEPKVTDFGLAKQLDEEESANTRTGTVMGTPSYMSPEQAQGLVHDIGAASDQYSIGAMLYELLTGRPPFLGTKAFDTISQVVHKEPIPPCQLQEKMPVDIDTICLKALQKSPAKRYANCQAMADDLTRFLQGEPIIARPVGVVERAWRWCRRNPLIAIPSAIAALLLVTTAVVSTWSFLRISEQATVIAAERDEAQDQRDEANKQRLIAIEKEAEAQAAEEKALQEKAEAERQQILANEAKLQAEKNQQLAEKQALLALQNIQLVVTEVDDRLAKEPGMTNIRVDLLEVLEKKWNELDLALAGGIQGQAIPTLMAVRGKIADAWASVDRLKESNAQYERLHQQAHERLLVKNRNDASRFNLALLCARWAPIRQRLTGDPAEAEKLLDESNALLRECLKDPRPEPGSPQGFQIADVLQQSLMRLASIQIKEGELKKAEANYQEIQGICQKVLDEAKGKAEWIQAIPAPRQAMITAYFDQCVDLSQAGMANVLCRLDRVEEAIPIFERLISKRKTALESTPEDRNARDQLALQLRNYGQYMLRSGRIDAAVRLLGQAHDLNAANHLADPENAAFKRAFGHALYYLGVARDEAAQPNDALVLVERSRVLRQEMVQASPDSANKVNLMLSLGRLGNQEAALALVEELGATPTKNPDLRIDLARTLAQLSKAVSEGDQRTQLVDRGIAWLERAVEDGLSDPYALTSEVDLKPLRDHPKMAQLVEQLRAGMQAPPEVAK